MTSVELTFTAVAPEVVIGGATSIGPAGSPGLVYRGTWSNVTAYIPKDVVYYNGSSYTALVNDTGTTPGSDFGIWALVVQGSATSLYYQIVHAPGGNVAQRTGLGVVAPLTATDNAGADRTDLGVALGSTPGTVAAGDDSRITGAQQTSAKGAASGYAALDGSTKVPIAQLPTGTGSTQVAIGNDTRITGAEQTTAKGAASGYAPLDGSSLIPAQYLPSIAISDFLGDVASQAAMLALVGQKGDWCTRSDTGQTYILQAGTGSTLSDWQLLRTPADAVSSVNGLTGAVSLPSDGAAGTASLRTLGTGAAQATAGNDSRLSDARTPTSHHTTHESGGTDAVTLAQSQITGLVTALGLKEATSNKGAAGGYAGLDGSAKVAVANLPVGSVAATIAAGDDSRFAFVAVLQRQSLK